MTVLVALIGLPVLFHCWDKLAGLPSVARTASYVLAGIAACILPWFGFITYLVTTDDAGVKTTALFQRQSCKWSDIKGLSRRSTMNWLRYVIELENNSQISFPTLLIRCDDLVSEIRSRLPAGTAAARSVYRTFHNDPVAFLLQALQAGAGIFFMAVCWLFFVNMPKKGDPTDAILMASFCALATAVLAWRTFVVSLMPKAILLQPDQLSVRTLFFERNLPWSEVNSVTPPSPLLPEGFMLKTRRGSFLVGSGMDASDELQAAIKSKLQPKSS
jgi:hypothetical protein